MPFSSHDRLRAKRCNFASILMQLTKKLKNVWLPEWFGSPYCLLINIKMQQSTWNIICKVHYLTTNCTFLTQWVRVQEITLHQYYCNQQKNSKRFTFQNYLRVFTICWSTQNYSKVLEILLIIMCLMKKW